MSIHWLIPEVTSGQKVDIFLESSDMMKRIFLGLFCIWCCHWPLFAQEAANLQALSDTAKINHINTLALQLQDSTAQHEQAITYAEEALQLSENISYDSGIFMAAHTLGNLYQKQAAYQQAQEHFNRALQIAEEADNPWQMAKVLERTGYNYYTQGEFDTAMAQYFRALKITESLNAQKLTARLYSNLGVVSFARQEYQQQLKYARMSQEIFEKIDDQKGLSFCYNNIANAYYYLENHEEALKYYLLSLEISQAAHDDKSIAVAYNNLGLFHYYRKEFDKALDYYRKGLQIKKKINDKQGEIYTLFNMGQLSSTQGNLSQAYDFLQQATKIAQEIGAKDRLVTCYRALADLHAKQENYQQAFEFHKQYTNLKDSLFNAEKNSKIAEMQARYESEKKDKEIELLNKSQALQASEIERKTIVQHASIGALVLFSIIAYILFRNFRQKRLLLHTQLVQEQKEAERMHELDRMKSNFFANIAHEFRTPLTLIMGPMEQLMDTCREISARQAAGLAYKNALQLLKLINQLLDLSRLEAGEGQMHFTERDFIAFAKGLLMSFESLEAQKNIRLQFEADEEELRMVFDTESLEKILSNLISNAFKYTPSGGTITLKVRKSQLNQSGIPEEAVRVDVTDTGVGIKAEDLPHVFDRFYRVTHNVWDDAESAGIGLALVKELVDLHRGSISVQSLEQEGSTFTILLPLRQAEYETDYAAPEQMGVKRKKDLLPVSDMESAVELTPEEAAEEEMADKELVLVVDDNPDVRHFIIQSLQKKYRILEAADGKEGIEMATTHVPDLIVCDVMMPRIDGYKVCKTLKQDEKTSHIPIVLLTAKWGMESKLQGLDTGADEYLAKPFNTKELLMRIRNLIAIRKSIRTKYLKELDSPALQPAQASGSGLAPREQHFLEKAKEAVKADLDNEDFGVEALSQALYMRRKNLHRKLKALTGQTPSLFIRIIRLQEAKILLESGSCSVQEAAYRVGFNSATYFSTCFSAQFGYAPSDEYTVKK